VAVAGAVNIADSNRLLPNFTVLPANRLGMMMLVQFIAASIGGSKIKIFGKSDMGRPIFVHIDIS
jgi:5,10-methylene-tetrahydrofolate dehydrogenase/methenyl tetrahydrofolate cyclohydrolase